MHCANCVGSMAAVETIKKLRNRAVYFCSMPCKTDFTARMKLVKKPNYDERIRIVLYWEDS
jgi:hypothetical protein